jgi:curved DNA-binding protein
MVFIKAIFLRVYIMKYYTILNVSENASESEIKKSYHKLAKEYHPDKNPSKQAEEKFKNISEAYHVLSDPKKRQEYNTFGDKSFSNKRSHEDIYSKVSVDDILREMGLGKSQKSSSKKANTNSQPEPSNEQNERQTTFKSSDDISKYDVEREIEIDFIEAYEGTEREIEINLSRSQTPSPQSLSTIKIPAGIQEGVRLRLSKKGLRSPLGLRGDLYLKIKISPHKRFVRVGNDIESTVFLPYSKLCLGGEVNLETPQGYKEVNIKAGMVDGVKLRLKGLGFPVLKSERKGDFLVYIKVQIPSPESLNSEKRQALDSLKNLGL